MKSGRKVEVKAIYQLGNNKKPVYSNPTNYRDIIQFQAIMTTRLTKLRKRTKIVQSTYKYNQITYQSRIQLINLVIEDGKSVYAAAKETGINHSTAKAIMRRYRRNGHVLKKKSEMANNQQNDFETVPIIGIGQISISMGQQSQKANVDENQDDRQVNNDEENELHSQLWNPYPFAWFWMVFDLPVQYYSIG